MMELSAKAEDKTPYVLVALQECERMNNLTQEIRRSLKELDLGLKVCLATSTTLKCIVYFSVIFIFFLMPFPQVALNCLVVSVFILFLQFSFDVEKVSFLITHPSAASIIHSLHMYITGILL